MVRKVLGFPIYFAVLAEENYPRSRRGGGGGCRSGVRLVIVMEGLGFIGGLRVRVDGDFDGLLLKLPANVV